MIEQHGKAGQGARDLAEKRRQARLKLGPALALCLLALAGLAFCAAKPGLLVLALPGLLLVRLWFQRLDAKLDRSWAEETRALRGAKGEEKVADLLAQLGEGYAVYHDLPSPYGNIDHLVLSRIQGLFLMETKAHGGRVRCDGANLLVNGKPPEKDFLAQVHRNRCWLRDELHRQLVLSCKLFANVNSLFANESEFVILGMHLARQLETGKGAWPFRLGSFRAVPSAGGNGGSSWSTTPGWAPLSLGK